MNPAQYAAAGWRVFPLCPGAKIPHKASHGCHDATTDPEVLAAMFGQRDNVGIATGEASGLFVVDVDAKDGRDGSATLDALQSHHGALPVTVCATTPTGGRHYYFRYPAGTPISISAEDLGRGLDVRGNRGYVVAPGSVVDGKQRKPGCSREIRGARVELQSQLSIKLPLSTTKAVAVHSVVNGAAGSPSRL